MFSKETERGEAERTAKHADSGKDPPKTSFSEKLRAQNEADHDGKGASEFSLLNLAVPLLICGTSVAVFLHWGQGHSKTTLLHHTVSQRSLSREYWLSLLLSSLSFHNYRHFLSYFPLMAYALLGLSSRLKNRHTLLAFATNAVVSSATAIAYECYDDGFMLKPMLPKFNGGATALFFMTLFVGLFPKHLVFGFKYLPFALAPAAFLFYEVDEFREVYVKEVSRPAHLVSIAGGLLFALAFRRAWI